MHTAWSVRTIGKSSEIIAPILESKSNLFCFDPMLSSIRNMHWMNFVISLDMNLTKMKSKINHECDDNNYNYIFYIFKGQTSKLIVVLILTCCEISKLVKVMYSYNKIENFKKYVKTTCNKIKTLWAVKNKF